MSDLIDRQAAIDALDEEPAVWDEKDEYEQGLNSQWHHDVNAIKAVPSAQPDLQPTCNKLATNCISRQAAIDAIDEYDFDFPNYMERFVTELRDAMKADIKHDIEALPSAQPEHLTDDDFETIRIHLSAYKERLCNQYRWKEAEEYQKIIDRFMSFASAQTEPQWIPCSKEPDTDRNVFIARGTHDNMTACIGHYDHDYKQWYEDRNWFAKCLYDGLYWCEMPTLPECYKEEQ